MTKPSTDRRSKPDEPVAQALQPLVRRMLGDDAPVAVRGWDGSCAGSADAAVTIVVHSPNALRRVLFAPGELGLARAHVAGDLDLEGDPETLLRIGEEAASRRGRGGAPLDVHALPDLWRLARRFGLAGRPPRPPAEEARLRGRRHSERRDGRAVSHHYDVSNHFYELVLGPTLTYSCAYWPSAGTTLDQAQTAKHELVARKLGLRPGMRLLDVGCGWGSMAIHAARHHGSSVVGVTVSQEQHELAVQRVASAGLSDHVEIRLQDYREIADGPFDAISSIGMFEHVGRSHMGEYLATLNDLLSPGGRLLNHAISRPEPSSRPAIDPRSFMGRYVFPDAELLEVGTVISTMQRLRLEVRDVQSLREHYARTLRAWLANLSEHWDEAQQAAGPGRARVWRLYLAASALGFDQHRTSVHQVLAVRPHDGGSSGMPPTRAGMDVDAGSDAL